MTPLRRRMIEDMRLHDLAPKTERAYVDAVAALARHYNRSPELLGEEDLREYWVISRPADLLFPSRYVPEEPASATSLQRAVRLAADEAGIAKHVTFHTLRHCYGTYLLECGVDLRTIQTLMGHKSCETTAIYTHLTDKTLERLGRALDELSENL